MQNDIHAPATTVYEALEFSAEMRVLDVDKSKLKDFVDQVGFIWDCVVDQSCSAVFVMPAPEAKSKSFLHTL